MQRECIVQLLIIHIRTIPFSVLKQDAEAQDVKGARLCVNDKKELVTPISGHASDIV